jgi:2-polyprenyl-3-methyl-5-hydroxy-6-metoxy-1,4-benzoquinol methylase
MPIKELYLNKPEQYIEHIVWEVIFEIPAGQHRVLDLGCAGGLLGATLKEAGKACEVIGVEISKVAAERAVNRLDKVIVGNIEDMQFDFQQNDFDYIILGDILEHLVDPWVFLTKITKYLKPQGRIIATMPNVRCWRVIIPLFFKGTWNYEWQGILDNGHLRFFTKKTMISLFKDAGLKICKIKAMVGKNLASGHSDMTLTAFIDKSTLGLFQDFLAPGYFIVSSKS